MINDQDLSGVDPSDGTEKCPMVKGVNILIYIFRHLLVFKFQPSPFHFGHFRQASARVPPNTMVKVGKYDSLDEYFKSYRPEGMNRRG
jgi:hypothetical protein